MIYLIGKATEPDPRYRIGEWEWFLSWLGLHQYEVEFDIETTVSDWWMDKKVITVQFGDKQNQWVMQWSELTDAQKAKIKSVLESKTIKKLIHNAMFECVVLLFHGIRVQNVFDTMLAEQVLYGGDHDLVEYGLDDVCFRRLGILLDKSQQLLFGDNILTPAKIVYAAQDVKYLGILKKEIWSDVQQYGLDWTVALECEVLLPFAEMVYHGMEVDQDVWKGLVSVAEPLVSASEEKLNAWLKTPDFAFMAYDYGHISDNDRILINWNSPKQKTVIFSQLFPELPGTTKAILQKFVSTRLKAKQEVPDWLHHYLDGNFQPLTDFLMTTERQWLIDSHLIIPAGTCTINWNSPIQVLPMIQCVEHVKDLSEETLAKTSHPIVLDYNDYKDNYKLLSSYGEKWLAKNVEPDGKVRTRFNQVLTTGRISSSKPNMQQIPAKEAVGNKYRNAFIPPAGWSYVSSDYASQELVVIAYLSQDPVWLEALRKGQDLHSIAAEMVFKKKWKDAAEPDCAYYKMTVSVDGILEVSHAKCKCHKHVYMRYGCKTINFGLAYGMSHFKLAAELRITVPEAKQLIIDYFETFPSIGRLLELLGHFGLDNGYIQTIWPFYRRRWFPNWKFYYQFIDSHKMQAQYHPGLGEIERASKNMPIQGTSADMMKLALCEIYWHIHENELSDKVRMIMQVHDQADINARDDFKEQWAPIQTSLMEKAAQFIIPSGILKAETSITEKWSK